MKVTVLGSHLCPDTVAAIDLYKERGVDFEFHNISESLASLKEFLAVRDNNASYDEVKAAGGIGIPVVVFEDGSITRNPEDVFAK